MIMKAFARILAATGFSPASQPALDDAERIAQECGARLLILHAYKIPALASLAQAPVGVYEDFLRAVETDAEKRLDALVAHARVRRIDARGLLRHGLADEEILEAAAKEKVDLIVMGTHGRRGASRLLMGSIASRVVSRAPCPVMTLRAAPAAA
jgi:nucleotide-binding universal stress UspA family protein